MCDFGCSERQYWIRRIEAYKKEMEQEELERQRKAAAPARPAQPQSGTVEPEPIPA